MPWNYRRFGTLAQPIHKSDLVEITGDYGCPRRFRYQQDELADNDNGRPSSPTVHAKTALGSAVHETISRALTNPAVLAAVLSDGPLPSVERVRATLEHEFRLACDGRLVEWNGDTPDDLITERVDMVRGALATIAERVAEVVAIEAGFCVELDGTHMAGHVDLVYRPKRAPDTLALADWKTGASKPHALELDHGWEAAIYSLALRDGVFLPREYVQLEAHAAGGWEARCHTHAVVRPTRWQAERDGLEAALGSIAAGEAVSGAVRYGVFPSEIHVVHLADFVPYRKAGKKRLTRPEDCEHYGAPAGTEVRYAAGELRGPGWLPVARKENDIRRLAHRLRAVVGTVRMGRFLDLVGERCSRCRYAADCLTGGYAPRGAELAELETSLREAGL